MDIEALLATAGGALVVVAATIGAGLPALEAEDQHLAERIVTGTGAVGSALLLYPFIRTSGASVLIAAGALLIALLLSFVIRMRLQRPGSSQGAAIPTEAPSTEDADREHKKRTDEISEGNGEHRLTLEAGGQVKREFAIALIVSIAVTAVSERVRRRRT